MNVSEETALIAFKAICNFINDLESEFGKKHKPLKLYKRLINHTQISHDAAIKKHLTIFHDFSMTNRDALSSQDPTKLVEKKLSYSDRVFVDMDFIFRLADEDTTKVIWQHILTISAIVDPASRAKDILKKHVDEGKGGNEADFLANIISKVEKSVKPDTNPMEAVNSILQSGLINEMMTDLSSKKLDMGKLLGVVQGMVSTLGSQTGDDPESKNAMNMLNSMVGSISNGGGPPNMMGMMTSLMSGMMAGGNNPFGGGNPLGGINTNKNIVEDVSEEKQKDN